MRPFDLAMFRVTCELATVKLGGIQRLWLVSSEACINEVY